MVLVELLLIDHQELSKALIRILLNLLVSIKKLLKMLNEPLPLFLFKSHVVNLDLRRRYQIIDLINLCFEIIRYFNLPLQDVI